MLNISLSQVYIDLLFFSSFVLDMYGNIVNVKLIWLMSNSSDFVVITSVKYAYVLITGIEMLRSQ